MSNSYAYEALLLNELAGRQFACDSYVPSGPGYPEPGSGQTTCSTVGSEPGNPFVSGDRYLLESYEYVNGHKWR
jgi:ATP-binding cassette subfamily G (WHITE) protein 2 (PDR)